MAELVEQQVDFRAGTRPGRLVRAGATEPGRATVVVLHGSDGKRRVSWAHQFALAGFDACAISWCERGPNLPLGVFPTVFEVAVEIVFDAVDWIRAHEGGPVVIVGHSKGAELALLAASLHPELIGGVSAWSPSSHVWAGFGSPNAEQRSTWSLGGEPIPFARPSTTPPWHDAVLDTPESADVAAARIRIEAFDGPIVLVSGADDRVWPSVAMAELIVDAGRPDRVKHVTSAAAGHFITPDLFDDPINQPFIQDWRQHMPEPWMMRGSDFIGGSEDADRRLADRGMAATLALLARATGG